MTRITSVEELVFPVALMPLFSEVKVNDQVRRIRVPNNRLVINQDTGAPLSVVNKNYRLISNQDAIELGKQCCMQLFDIGQEQHISVFNVDAPSTASYCHIDLVHKDRVINLRDGTGTPDYYIPYVRVTNSYNRTRSLRFDIGFYRKSCLNGIIFEAETIGYTYNHSKSSVGKINFSINQNKIDDIARNFKDDVTIIRAFEIDEIYSFEILKSALNLKQPNNQNTDYDTLISDIQNLHTSYRNELGGNAYALFNTITDVASRPPRNRIFQRKKHSLQKLAGAWIRTFRAKLVESDAWIKTIERTD